MKKKEASIGFSYLDVFFVLLAVLLLSFFIYFSAEEKRQENLPVTLLTVKAVYEKELFYAIPSQGETLFDSNGEPFGTILRVRVGEGEKEREVEMDLSVPDSGWSVGDFVTVDTPVSVKEGVILKIEKEQNEKGEGV